eukprot:Gregarina_sp_Poly_1__9895@NODE_645_length_6980_cov_171_671922_g491_i0_p4_GENE_NODE_645_length_6980_cov_171_671922_g491_i0NODE_645_length_6980_cov_171_671922_g491_i0_p4_ORF_typecomplete_len266_score48_30FeS_assembly/PF04384_13/0_37TetR_C_29/PF17938_1/4e02TetR_C_29/PF17938_1/1_1TetR_C_29/PF17938_1/8_2e03_NODE_645_length_6980_cov_171_671922_g491_i027793576
MAEQNSLKLVLFLTTAASLELLIAKKLRTRRQEPLQLHTVAEGLTFIVRDSFELLTDVSQVARQLLKGAKAEANRALTFEEMHQIVMTESLHEKLQKIKEEALRRLNVKNLDHFYRSAESFRNNDTIRSLLDGYEMMVHDAVVGILPIMPCYDPQPFLSADEVLRHLTMIQQLQTKQVLRVFSQAIEEEGREACSQWMATSGGLDGTKAPSHISSSLRAAIRGVEDDIIKSAHNTLGDRRNFMHLIAVCHRDSEFAEKVSVGGEI